MQFGFRAQDPRRACSKSSRSYQSESGKRGFFDERDALVEDDGAEERNPLGAAGSSESNLTRMSWVSRLSEGSKGWELAHSNHDCKERRP